MSSNKIEIRTVHAILVFSMYSQLPTNTSLNLALLMVVDSYSRYHFPICQIPPFADRVANSYLLNKNPCNAFDILKYVGMRNVTNC